MLATARDHVCLDTVLTPIMFNVSITNHFATTGIDYFLFQILGTIIFVNYIMPQVIGTAIFAKPPKAEKYDQITAKVRKLYLSKASQSQKTR